MINLISKQIGRNDPCWCGSGIKFKKCHLDRESQDKVNHWDSAKEFKKTFSKRYCCVPDELKHECEGGIIKAHTVTKSSSLKSIAKNGKVYGLKITLDNIRKHKGKLQPELIGINQASIFTGFCKKHDNDLFAIIEKQSFELSQETVFKLAYRSFCKEFYAKKAASELEDHKRELDKGRSIEEQQDIQMSNFLSQIGTYQGNKDNLHHKEQFDNAIKNNDFSTIQAVSFKLEEPPHVMVSGATNPIFDFSGNQIQDLGDLGITPDLLAVNSFYDGSHGYIVFSWLNSSNGACAKFINSLFEQDKNDQLALVYQYIMQGFENIFFCPDWWESLSDKVKRKVIKGINDNVSPTLISNSNAYTSSWLKLDLPNIIEIQNLNHQ